MLSPEKFLDFLWERQVSFFTGVPDSLLQAFCISLYNRFGTTGTHHVVAANEGSAVALGAGYHLATGKIPLVYMQNSGLGNAVNPTTSLTDPAVYGIPMIYVIGWRGEPGTHDEPQHVKQGAITSALLEVLDIPYMVIEKETTIESIATWYHKESASLASQGKSLAFIVKKGSFTASQGGFPVVTSSLSREGVIQRIASGTDSKDYVVSTTGKISRELYEYRKDSSSPFSGHDFLTVGSMGHASSIALSISIHHPRSRIWCLDGDGAVLMHMGSMATIGTTRPSNLIHVILNNGSHESVGGMPTVAQSVDLCKVAEACGYQRVRCIRNESELSEALDRISQEPPELTFLEIMVASGSRPNLIRPDTTPRQNKTAFMESLQGDRHDG